MTLQLKRRLQKNIGIICSLLVLFTVVPVYATDTDDLEKQSASLQKELEGINSEIVEMGTEIANIELQIESTNNSIIITEEQLSIIMNNESEQYEEMKSRIKYMYENGSSSLIDLLCSAESIADFVNKADFIGSISDYDRSQLDALQATHATIEEQQANLNEQKSSLETMQDDLNAKQEALNQKAAETSTNLSEISSQIAQIKEEQARKAAEAAAAQAQAEANANASSGGSSSGGGSSSPSYSYPTSGGALTPSKGVVYFNGHRETYYSQRVLPGTGLNIPGRHVAGDGTIRDRDNYICVASSDLPKGTVVETSLGMGKVYDSGCASGTIDIYTDW